jgi:hypothetical protein
MKGLKRLLRLGGKRGTPTALIGLALSALLLTGAAPAAASPHHHHPCSVRSPDTDHDHLPDCWEHHNGLVVGRHDQNTDKDGDGLLAKEEFAIDVATTGDRGIFFPYRADKFSSAGDRYNDGDIDPDGDGYTNLQEVVFRSDPMNAASTPVLPVGTCATVPSTVASNGSMNVTLRLQAVIDTVPDGSCLDLSPDARFRSDGTLSIDSRNNFTINGNGALLFSNVPGHIFRKGTPASKRLHLGIIGGSNITVDGLRIRGPNPVARYNGLYEFEAGVVVSGVVGEVLSNLTISHVYGDFITFSQHDGIPAQNVLVTGGHFSIAGRQGLAFSQSASNITVEDSTFDGMGRSGTDIELISLDNVVSNVTIQNNTWSNFHLFWVSATGGTSNGVHYLGNQLTGETMQAKLGSQDWVGHQNTDFTFVGNSSDTPVGGSAPLFNFKNTDNVAIQDNYQTFMKGSGIGVAVTNGCGYTVDGNQFVNGQVDLLFVDGVPC